MPTRNELPPPSTVAAPPPEDLALRLRRLEEELAGLRALLRAQSPSSRPTERFEVLPCRVGDEQIGVALERVREVAPIARLTALPESPPWVLGLLNLRGSSIPVLDLAARLRRERREPALSELILVVESRGRRVGVVVGAVEPARGIEPSAIDPDVGALPLGPYLAGTVADPETGHLLLFDLDTLFELSDLPEAR